MYFTRVPKNLPSYVSYHISGLLPCDIFVTFPFMYLVTYPAIILVIFPVAYLIQTLVMSNFYSYFSHIHVFTYVTCHLSSDHVSLRGPHHMHVAISVSPWRQNLAVCLPEPT